MKYYLIAGEASGDLHGSNLMKALHTLDKQAHMRCWGGDKMQAAGGELVKHFKELAFMGFAEVVANLRTILRNLSFCKADIAAYQPDVLVLIDYPGFNLRIAEWAKQQGIKVVYYISPQVWAWKENRVKKMKQCIDHMMVILPFEKNYYKDKWQWEVEYVGHPLVSVIEQHQPLITHFSQRPIVALLPGSRKQEIQAKLPIMLEASKAFPEYQFVVAMAPSLDDAYYRQWLDGYSNVSAVGGATYDLLQQAKAALVTSGTATLETALFGVPQVVCYKGNPISYAIARRLIQIKYISLVNLIMDQTVVKELIQHELTVDNVVAELRQLLQEGEYRHHMTSQYAALKNLLSQDGDASYKAAASVYRVAKG